MKMAYWMGEGPTWYCSVDGAFSATVIESGSGACEGELKQPTAGGPFNKIHVDLTGFHVRSKNGFVYLVTAIDYITKYLICVSIKQNGAVCRQGIGQARVFAIQMSYSSNQRNR